MLGFEIDLWDYITFLSLFIIGLGLVAALVLLAGLPGENRHRAQAPRRRGREYHGLGRLPRCGAMDPGLHLGLQADRYH